MRRTPVAPLRAILQHQRFDLSRFYADKRVEGRDVDGTLLVRPLGGECVERTNICSAYAGQIIQVPCGAGLRNLGAAGTAMASTSLLIAPMWVESITPDFFARGATVEVTVIGRGFTPSSVFEFLLPGTDEVNPGVAIVASTYVSVTEFLLEVEVAVDAVLIPEGAGAIAFDNPGTPI